MSADAKNLVVPELLDADNQPIELCESQEYIGDYKGWALINQDSGCLVEDGKPLIFLHALMPDENYPGKYCRTFYQFNYTGESEGSYNTVDAVDNAKKFIDTYEFKGDPSKTATKV